MSTSIEKLNSALQHNKISIIEDAEPEKNLKMDIFLHL